MKLSIKIFSFVFFITGAIKCMNGDLDPSSRSIYSGHQTRQITPDKSLQNELNHELSRVPEQEGERKQSQAELDKLQFEKEKETKLLQARCNQAAIQEQNANICNGLKELLKDAKINDKPFDVKLIDRLPSEIQENIATMIYSCAFTHGYQLLPALIPCCSVAYRPSLENVPGSGLPRYKRNFIVKGVQIDDHYHVMHSIRECQKKGQNFVIAGEPLNSTLSFYNKKKRLAPCNVSGKIVNDNLYLDRGAAKNTLEACSLEQLELIRRLWKKNNISSGGQSLYLNQEATHIYNSLPTHMRNNLEKNYDIVTYKMVAYTFFYAALAGAAAAALARWLSQ